MMKMKKRKTFKFTKSSVAQMSTSHLLDTIHTTEFSHIYGLLKTELLARKNRIDALDFEKALAILNSK